MVGSSTPSQLGSSSGWYSSDGEEYFDSSEDFSIISNNRHGADTGSGRCCREHLLRRWYDELVDDTTSFHESFHSAKDYEFSDEDHESSAHADGHDDSSYLGDGPSEPSSPIDIPGQDSGQIHRRAHGSTFRDGLLAEAWQRKKELALELDELSNLKDRSMPHLLGRSSSYNSGNAPSTKAPMGHDAIKHRIQLERSASDTGYDAMQLARARTHSLTDDDFEELKGFIDLGFHFDETSLPTLRQTLPALEVYCAVAQDLQESAHCPCPTASPARSMESMPSTPRWKVFSPGDDPEEVKGRLRHWAQAVACNARLCS